MAADYLGPIRQRQLSTNRAYTLFERLMHTACSTCGRKVTVEIVGFYWLKNLPCGHAEQWLPKPKAVA